MYEEFYKLDRAPFDTTPDPTFFFMSDGHQEALAALVYGIDRRKGFISLIGEVGTGKTTVLRAYIESEHVKNTRIIYLFNPRVSYEDLLLMVLRELRVEIPEGETKRVDLLHRVLVNEYKNGHNVVLIVDEAQNIPPETLESMRMLSNLETSSEKLIQIVLSGQPELEGILASSRLRQLRQRIAVKVKLDPLSHQEASEYVRYRMRRAGGEDNVFTKDAIDWVVRYTGGNPRSINVLCDNALITGYGYQQFPISTPVVKEIAKDFDIERWNSKNSVSSTDWLRRAAMLLAVVGVAGFAYLMGMNKDTRIGDDGGLADAVSVEESSEQSEVVDVDEKVLPEVESVASLPDVAAEPKNESDVGADTVGVDESVEKSSLLDLKVVEDVSAKPVFESVVETIESTKDEAAEQEPEVAESAPMAEIADEINSESSESTQSLADTSDVAEAGANDTDTGSIDQSLAEDDQTEASVRVARLQDSDSTAAIEPAQSVEQEEQSKPAAEGTQDSTDAIDEPSSDDLTEVLIDGVRQLIPVSEIDAGSSSQDAVSNSTSVLENEDSGEENDLAGDDGSTAQTMIAESSVVGASTEQAERIVQNGDRLWDMAADVYGRVDDNIVTRILETNPGLANADAIFVGQKIIFPEL